MSFYSTYNSNNKRMRDLEKGSEGCEQPGRFGPAANPAPLRVELGPKTDSSPGQLQYPRRATSDLATTARSIGR